MLRRPGRNTDQGLTCQATKCDHRHGVSYRDHARYDVGCNARRFGWWLLRNKRSPDWCVGSRNSGKGISRRINGTSTITTASKQIGILIF
jgi:hypothetical protein